ncbi:hypothetical protein HPB48_000853 [Haemaphysalis longicornis]|uniref:Uncharacterized protein n=1 Tax=Haemaphysalis longicornis TaxID=44386 RepID=A0A9J6FQ68_HAELO|nr:hypothetical protein HPB48_000853 [Haemaphysalis longicornis]
MCVPAQPSSGAPTAAIPTRTRLTRASSSVSNCLGPHRSDDATCSKKLEADAVVRKQAFLKCLIIRKHATATPERASHRGDLSPLVKAQPRPTGIQKTT